MKIWLITLAQNLWRAFAPVCVDHGTIYYYMASALILSVV